MGGKWGVNGMKEGNNRDRKGIEEKGGGGEGKNE